MKFWQRLNRIGITLTLLFIILGELMWILDPIKFEHRIYWIDLMDYVIYFCTVIPLIWLISAAIGVWHIGNTWRENQRNRFGYLCLLLLRTFIVVSSAFTIYFILIDPYRIIGIGVSLVLAWLFVLIDPVIEHWVKYRSITWRGLSILGISISLLAMLCWPTPYMVTYPGLTLNMNQYAKVQDGKSNGEIMGVLIFERPAFPVDWLYAHWNSFYEFNKRKTDVPLGKQLQVVRTLKQDANQVGSAVAFKKAGLGQGATSHGARIVGIIPETPAAEQLKLDDVITNINSQAISSAAELIQYIKTLKPDDEIHLVLDRNNKKISLSIKLQEDSNDPKKARLGVQITDELQLDLPLRVDFHPYMVHEGGPSHGAMLALALIDQLTPGGVTNGNIVAGTGTINIDGSIGPIGGIKQKAYTVERAGADVFFVPAIQFEDARKGAENLNIVPVKTLDQILSWLKEHRRPEPK